MELVDICVNILLIDFWFPPFLPFLWIIRMLLTKHCKYILIFSYTDGCVFFRTKSAHSARNITSKCYCHAVNIVCPSSIIRFYIINRCNIMYFYIFRVSGIWLTQSAFIVMFYSFSDYSIEIVYMNCSLDILFCVTSRSSYNNTITNRKERRRFQYSTFYFWSCSISTNIIRMIIIANLLFHIIYIFIIKCPW